MYSQILKLTVVLRLHNQNANEWDMIDFQLKGIGNHPEHKIWYLPDIEHFIATT